MLAGEYSPKTQPQYSIKIPLKCKCIKNLVKLKCEEKIKSKT